MSPFPSRVSPVLPLPVAADVGVSGAEGSQESGIHRQHCGPQQHPARRDYSFTMCLRTFPLPTHRSRPQLQIRPPCRAGFAFLHPEKQPWPRPCCSPSTSLCQGETEARPFSSLGGPTQPHPSILRRSGSQPGHHPDLSCRTPSQGGEILPWVGTRGAGVQGAGFGTAPPASGTAPHGPIQPVLCLFPVVLPGSISFLLNPERVRLCRGGSRSVASRRPGWESRRPPSPRAGRAVYRDECFRAGLPYAKEETEVSW